MPLGATAQGLLPSPLQSLRSDAFGAERFIVYSFVYVSLGGDLNSHRSRSFYEPSNHTPLPLQGDAWPLVVVHTRDPNIAQETESQKDLEFEASQD